MKLEGDASSEDTMAGIKRESPPSTAGRAIDAATRKRCFDGITNYEKRRRETLWGAVEDMLCFNWSINIMGKGDIDSLDASGPTAEALAEPLPTPSSRSRNISPSKRPKTRRRAPAS
jgi:hypothetical protein